MIFINIFVNTIILKGDFIMDLTNEMKKIFLMGIGAAATTAEKSKEIIDNLIEKGELTVEQGKALNEELKYKFANSANELIDKIETMSDNELAKIKEKIAEVERKNAEGRNTKQ